MVRGNSAKRQGCKPLIGVGRFGATFTKEAVGTMTANSHRRYTMTEKKTMRFKFFLPEARVMRDEEVKNLPAEKIQAAEAEGKSGLWIEINCPDRSCLSADGRLVLPTEKTAGKGVFLNLFCPEDACEIVQGTDLP